MISAVHFLIASFFSFFKINYVHFNSKGIPTPSKSLLLHSLSCDSSCFSNPIEITQTKKKSLSSFDVIPLNDGNNSFTGRNAIRLCLESSKYFFQDFFCMI